MLILSEQKFATFFGEKKSPPPNFFSFAKNNENNFSEFFETENLLTQSNKQQLREKIRSARFVFPHPINLQPSLETS